MELLILIETTNLLSNNVRRHKHPCEDTGETWKAQSSE